AALPLSVFPGAAGEDVADYLAVVEGENLRPDVLVRLVALPRNDERIARAGPAQRVANRLSSIRVTSIAAGGRGCYTYGDFPNDGARILRSGVVGREPHPVGQLGCDPAHDRALLPVPVAAGAEHHAEAAPGEPPRRLQHPLERV